MRLRDIGEVAIWSGTGNAVAVRAAILIHTGATGPGWGGQLWPYRPLALTPGRYTLRVRGEDIGMLAVEVVRTEGDREVGDFVGDGAPSRRLLQLVAQSRGVHAGRGLRFPRVAGEVERTSLSKTLSVVGAPLRRMLGRRHRSAAWRR